MKQIELTDNLKWGIAKKTKPIKAKPAVSVMVDKSVLSNFLISTLEGREPLSDGSVICVGESNDIWQQSPKTLLKKYDVTSIDKDGWMICEPYPDNSVECIQITKEMTSGIEFLDLFIVGLWGEQISLKDKVVQIQRGDYGDFICRNRENEKDVWIVKEKLFRNTYVIIS